MFSSIELSSSGFKFSDLISDKGTEKSVKSFLNFSQFIKEIISL